MLWRPTSTTRVIAKQAQHAGTVRNKKHSNNPKGDWFFGQGLRSTTQLCFGLASAVLNFSGEEAVVREPFEQWNSQLKTPPNSVVLKSSVGEQLTPCVCVCSKPFLLKLAEFGGRCFLWGSRWHSLLSPYSSSGSVFMSRNQNEALRRRASRTMMCAMRVVTKQAIAFCWGGATKTHSSACAIHTCTYFYVCV